MDINVQAYRLVQQATEEKAITTVTKRLAARKGGLAGGLARASVTSPERRIEIARKANAARWQKSHPTA
jgi:hypothetical protein